MRHAGCSGPTGKLQTYIQEPIRCMRARYPLNSRISQPLQLSAFIFIVVAGLLVMTGWSIHDPALIQINPSFVPMQFNTALSFLLVGIAGIALIRQQFIAARAVAVLAGVIALLTLLEYGTGADFHIDQLLMQHYITTQTPYPGRMAANTAASFILAVTSLLLLTAPPFPYRLAISAIAAALIAGLSTSSLIGYAIDLEAAHGWHGMSHMAVHTAFCFFVLGATLLLCIRQIEQDHDGNSERWLPASLAVIAMSITLELYRAMAAHTLQAHETDSSFNPATVILLFGTLMSIAVVVAVRASQLANRQLRLQQQLSLQLDLSNQTLEHNLQSRIAEAMRLEMVLNTTTDYVSMTDLSGNLLYLNAGGRKLIGLDEQRDISTLNIADMHPPAQSALILDEGMTCLMAQGIWSGETLLHPLHGDDIPVSKVMMLHRDENGAPMFISTIIRDIRELKAAQDDLRLEAEQYETIKATTRDGYWLVNMEGIIIDANEAYARISGYSMDEIIGAPVQKFEIIESPEETAARIDRIMTNGFDRFETRHQASDGHILNMEISASYWPGRQGIIVFVRDITDHVAYDSEREKLIVSLDQSNQELQQFAYVASHDLQEPLRMVSSYVQLIARRYSDKLDQDGQDFIHYAVDGAERMQQLIQDLLLYSRVKSHGAEFQPVDMNQIFQQCLFPLELMIRESEASIHCETLPEIEADPTQMRQLITNLLQNAIKFSRPDGSHQIHVAAERVEGGWQFSVRDHGIGIEKDYFDKIFVIFQRLHTRDKYPGTGIGLALCQRIVTRHGGHIRVESEVGKGSTFIFFIPDHKEALNEHG
ncbi:PAS domain S-box protein [Mariprofundus erugo]|nr:PAS domain S-box protein [Mariprofundus erugo]